MICKMMKEFNSMNRPLAILYMKLLGGVRLLTKEEESNNTSKEILKLLENFEKNVENIIKNVETNLIDKKRKSLINHHEKIEKKKANQRLYSDIHKEVKELSQLAPDIVKAELLSITKVNIRISADLKPL